MLLFPTCSACRPPSQAPFCHCTLRTVTNRPEGTFRSLRYAFGGDHPSQTTRQALSPSSGLEPGQAKGRISTAAPRWLAPPAPSLRPILHIASPDPTLSCSKGSRSAGIPALNDVNLEIDDGEFVFVCGDSGSGKSTLIKLLLKELDPTDGTITVDGRNLARIRHKQVPKYRRNVGVVFQDFRLLKDRNVYENVAFALKVIGASTAVIKKKVPQMLSMVGLAAKYKSKPRELSGGEQQRVAIARALVNEPSMLLADEPTGNLDNNNAWEIMKLLEEINEKGTTVIVVTHNLEIVKVMKKRVITIKKGLVVSDSKDGDSDED